MAPARLTFDAGSFRQEFMNLPLTPAWENLDPPKRSEIYVPAMHSKALSPEVTIVEGMRGAGKSFWTAVLADDQTRHFVSGAANIQGLSSNLIVRVGFGLDLDNERFPSAQRITAFMAGGCRPDDIWRSVLLRQAMKALNLSLPCNDTVDAAAGWVNTHHDRADQCLTECDRELVKRGQILLLLFDSLDRLADDWASMRAILSAALKLGLECRTRRAIRCKFFLRPDMLEDDDEIWHFADSSKLLHSKVELAWRPHDLFGLILLHLANSATVGEMFRETLQRSHHISWPSIDGVYPLPRQMTAAEQPLRTIIESLAGAWVGTTAKRGLTFKWMPTHLSDAKGRLSPRSMLLAFKRAADWTAEHHADCPNALHYEGIQKGIAEASKIRVDEIKKEDYPWVGPLLLALKDATVPLTLPELTERWTPSCIKAALDAAQEFQRLPPRRYSSDPVRPGTLSALVDDLVELAVLYRTEDKRLNMPDIFRVGFGIKRKGGVRSAR